MKQNAIGRPLPRFCQKIELTNQFLVKAHSLERPTDFSPNVSENGLVKAYSFQILGEK